MAQKVYTRLNLVSGLRDHFGLQSNTDNNNILIAALDEAVGEIVRKRRSWHFLEQELVIDVGASKTGIATFTQGLATATKTAGDEPAVLDVLVDEDTSNITNGWRVTAFAAPVITLDANYVEASGSKSYTAVVGWFPLPLNFVSMDGPLWDIEELRSKIFYKPPQEFQNIIRSKTITVGRPLFYTVVADPTAELDPQITDRLDYLRVYPYIMDRTTLRGTYQVHPQALDADTAVPILPREFRPVLIDWARWSVSVRLRQEAAIIQSYMIQAQGNLRDMLTEYEYVDDVPDIPIDARPGFDYPIEGSSSQGDSILDFV